MLSAKINSEILSKKPENEIALNLKMLLLECKNLNNLRFSFNRTVFHLLVAHRKFTVLTILLNVPELSDYSLLSDRRQNTILHQVVMLSGGEKLLQSILQYRPELVNIQNRHDETALHIAVKWGHLWAVQMLLGVGSIDLSLRNIYGETASTLARSTPDIYQLISSSRIPGLNLFQLQKNACSSERSSEINALFTRLVGPGRMDGAGSSSEVSEFNRYETELEQLSDEFSAQVFEGMLTQGPDEDCGLDLEQFDVTGRQLFEAIDLIIRDNVKTESESINLTRLMRQIMTINYQNGLVETVSMLRLVFNSYNGQKKSIMYYLVWQLICQNPDALSDDPHNPLMQELSWLLQSSSASHSGQGSYEVRMTDYFQRLQHLILDSYHSLLAIHYQQANRFDSSPLSFEGLVRRAIVKLPEDRKDDVALIASELGMVSTRFYSTLELYGFAKDRSQAQISEHTRFCEFIGTWFRTVLLEQPKDNLVNGFRMFLEIARHLFSIDAFAAHDLNSLMIIILNVLESQSISRLINPEDGKVERLSAEETEMLEQYRTLISPVRGSKWLMIMKLAYVNALPYFQHFLKFWIEVKEGNEDLLNRTEVLGGLISDLLLVKRIAIKSYGVLKSDLMQFTQCLTPIDCDTLYNQSIRFRARSQDIINLDESGDGAELLDRLKNHFIANEIIPALVWKHRVQPPEYTTTTLVHFFNKQLRVKRSDYFSGSSIEALREVMSGLVSLSLRYGVHINPMFMATFIEQAIKKPGGFVSAPICSSSLR